MTTTIALRYCAHPGCSARVSHGRCRVHARGEGDRPAAAIPARRWYRIARWRHPVYGLRAAVLREATHCATCGRLLLDGDIQIDHVVPHDGDRDRFFDRANLQALCLACHARKTLEGQ